MTQDPLINKVDPGASTEFNDTTDEPQYRQDASNYKQENNLRTTDRFEGLTARSEPDLPDSPSSESDAAISDPAMDAGNSAPLSGRDLASSAGPPLDDELLNELEDADLNENLPDTPQEIAFTDAIDPFNPNIDVATPEYSDYNVPGEIDIEELDEAALSDTDIPPDALLDALEE